MIIVYRIKYIPVPVPTPTAGNLFPETEGILILPLLNIVFLVSAGAASIFASGSCRHPGLDHRVAQATSPQLASW